MLVPTHKKGKDEQMGKAVRVSIEVRNGAARFNVAVQAESIRRAVGIVARRYPDRDIGVKFPIDPEGFFVEDRAAQAGIVGLDLPKKVAA